MQQRLYASHWLGHDGATDECRPDLYTATLMPFGQSVRCLRMGCDDEWVLAQTTDATKALSDGLVDTVNVANGPDNA